MAEGSDRQREQFQQIVDDWADLANRLVSKSAALAKRVVRQEEDRPGLAGPLQDLWMTLADAAGDIAELSYKWVQAVDGLSGFSRGSGTGAATAAHADASEAARPTPTLSPAASRAAPSKKAATGRRTPTGTREHE
jgi:hypothetical protein